MMTSHDLKRQYNALVNALIEAVEAQDYETAWQAHEDRLDVLETMQTVFGMSPRAFAETERDMLNRLLRLEQ